MEPGSFVLQVSATDPDGPNGLIKYSLDIGAKDNFVIDERSGVDGEGVLCGKHQVQETGDKGADAIAAIHFPNSIDFVEKLSYENWIWCYMCCRMYEICFHSSLRNLKNHWDTFRVGI